MQPSDTPLIDESLPAHSTATDVQRAALRELVSLLTESATTESEIESRHAAAREELNKTTASSRQDIEHRYARLAEESEQKHVSWVAEVDAKYQEGFESLNASNEKIRKRINHDHDGVIAGVKRRFEQASFMADSLLEAT